MLTDRSPWRAAPLLAVLIGCFLAVSAAPAQKDGPDTLVFRLKYAKADDTARVLREVYAGKIAPKGPLTLTLDERTNALLVSGTPALLREVEQLVREKLDVPAADAKKAESLHLIRLNTLAADKSLSDALRLLVGERGARFVLMPAQKTILFYGSRPVLDEVEALLARLEEQGTVEPGGQSLQVRVLWLVGVKDAKAGVPATAFRDLSDELTRLGLDQFRIAVHTFVQATPERIFEVSGGTTVKESARLNVAGKLSVPKAGKVHVDLSVTVVGARGKDVEILCSVQSEVTVALNKITLLGAATAHGEPSAFLVQVIDPTVKTPAPTRIEDKNPAKTPPVKGEEKPALKKLVVLPAGTPWVQALEWFARQHEMAFIVSSGLKGDCPFAMASDAPIPEQMDRLNEALQSQGFFLIRRQKAIFLNNLADKIDPARVPLVPHDRLGEFGRTELIHVFFPLKSAKVTIIAPEISKLLGPLGSLKVDEPTNTLIVQDAAGNVRMVFRELTARRELVIR